MRSFSFFIYLLFYLNCQMPSEQSPRSETNTKELTQEVNSPAQRQLGKTIAERFLPPSGYERKTFPDDSFATYLRQLPLQPAGHLVHYFNGETKPNYDVYAAVVDLPIGKRDLHQCADAVMRLRAEYLWKNKRYDDIHFNFTNGMQVDYSEWRKGKRMRIDGNKTYWVNSRQPSDTYTSFWKYLELIFAYAGTASLAKEMQSVALDKLQIGDVFIQGGFPGHAVIVLDVIEHISTGKRLFMLGQSYMPAQEIQVLQNPMNASLSPWYELNSNQEIQTPEWTFYRSDLKRF
ncbi:MAG: DUF4846 domain-containing protein [Saprospiraceae bacterium]